MCEKQYDVLEPVKFHHSIKNETVMHCFVLELYFVFKAFQLKYVL